MQNAAWASSSAMTRPSSLTIVALLLIFVQAKSQNVEQNAVYATQLTFETSSPVIYITTGICIGELKLCQPSQDCRNGDVPMLLSRAHFHAESAVKVGDKIQIFLPAFQDILAWHFIGLAKNLAYIVDFEENKAAYDFSTTSFTIDTRAGVASVHLVQDPCRVFDDSHIAIEMKNSMKESLLSAAVGPSYHSSSLLGVKPLVHVDSESLQFQRLSYLERQEHLS